MHGRRLCCDNAAKLRSARLAQEAEGAGGLTFFDLTIAGQISAFGSKAGARPTLRALTSPLTLSQATRGLRR